MEPSTPRPPATPPNAVVVAVGDELLLGRTVDSNAAWLGVALAELGLPVPRRYTVADVAAEIAWAVTEAGRAAEVVIVTGGLGPTPDDLTREAVEDLPAIRAAGAPVELANAHGTAPGLVYSTDDTSVVLLPGVPREMRGIFSDGVAPLLRRRFEGRLVPVVTRTVHTTGIPESRLSEQVTELLRGMEGGAEEAVPSAADEAADRTAGSTGPPDVGIAFLPDVRGVDVRFTARGIGVEEAEERFDALERLLAPALDPWRFAAPSGDLAEAVVEALRGCGATLAVAESCTGGLVGKRVTEVAGASEIFRGGIIAYANDVKTVHLGVDHDVLTSHGAVSELVAVALARGARERFGSDAGIGVTGIAGPGGGTEEKPVGTVWYAAAWQDRVETRVECFPGDRAAVRERAAQAALFLLLRLVEGRRTPAEASRG